MANQHKNRIVAVVAPRAGVDGEVRYRVTPAKAARMVQEGQGLWLADGVIELVAASKPSPRDAAANEAHAIRDFWLQLCNEPEMSEGEFACFVASTSPYRWSKKV